jgi:hypothetical protein
MEWPPAMNGWVTQVGPTEADRRSDRQAADGIPGNLNFQIAPPLTRSRITRGQDDENPLPRRNACQPGVHLARLGLHAGRSHTKREELAGLVARLTEQNPQKAKEINDELQGMELGTASKDLPDKCQLIDKRIKELKEAEKNLSSARFSGAAGPACIGAATG